MIMATYRVTGTFYPGDEHRNFTVEVDAENEDVAREHTLAELGSKHRLKRTQISVSEVEEA